MNVYYDEKVDALYLQFGDETPDGVVELDSGVGLDTTADGKLVGIEILNVSHKIDLTTILSYQFELADPSRIFPSLRPGQADSVPLG